MTTGDAPDLSPSLAAAIAAANAAAADLPPAPAPTPAHLRQAVKRAQTVATYYRALTAGGVAEDVALALALQQQAILAQDAQVAAARAAGRRDARTLLAAGAQLPAGVTFVPLDQPVPAREGLELGLTVPPGSVILGYVVTLPEETPAADAAAPAPEE